MKTQTALEQISAKQSRSWFDIFIAESLSLFKWWYIEIPTWYTGFIQRALELCNDTLSVTLLFRTFFVPWHRDNSWVGYFIGILFRVIYLPTALFITLTFLVVLLAIALVWALLPPASIFFLIKSAVGL
jgi:hypothetical protein